MKIHKNVLRALLITTGFLGSLYACASDENTEQLIQQGKYIATAADCGACHRQTKEDGEPFAGGYAIDSPMGRIIASNITPSKQFGIGNYTESQFADAVRKGVAANGDNLYPAMPYTAYHAMTDADIHALYTYFMKGVTPVDHAPDSKTELSFPFNIRQIMWGWNLLFSSQKPFEAPEGGSEQLSRGKYLTEVLGHCSTCHTPRNVMMAEIGDKNLSGSALGGWYAPNITPDSSGIGDWSQQDIVTYLKTGHVAGKAQAAGPMAEAVEHSFSHLSDSDLNAIAAWVKQVPSVSTEKAETSHSLPATPDINQVVHGQGSQASLAESAGTDGAELYNGACASCHGIHGQGTKDNFYPSLTHNSAVSSATPQNLVMTIIEGIHRKSSDSDVAMPAFKDQLTDAQVAAITSFVRLHFAGIDHNVTAGQVSTWRQGGEKPFIVKYINLLMTVGIVLAIIVIAAILAGIKRRKR